MAAMDLLALTGQGCRRSLDPNNGSWTGFCDDTVSGWLVSVPVVVCMLVHKMVFGRVD